MCSIQRPLDSRTELRVAVEAEAIVTVLGLCESGQLELIGSEALLFELERNPHPARKDYGAKVLARATVLVRVTGGVVGEAHRLMAAGVKPMDALHLASAIIGRADYFCTCDDRLLKRAKAADTLKTKVVSPLELVGEVAG
jgi:predicted nucleic acid-binding protein